ncbi:hypothetical protein CSUI_002867 [Cystoisospora suis]|uniref:Uncharacterized protein n=1 Tax=Cystoisospora suis TaxID=483139 RepID=A0A2C6L773_9APIC|nr:hypothetical protein CSUI_002867 [Cystoisospora suis]
MEEREIIELGLDSGVVGLAAGDAAGRAAGGRLGACAEGGGPEAVNDAPPLATGDRGRLRRESRETPMERQLILRGFYGLGRATHHTLQLLRRSWKEQRSNFVFTSQSVVRQTTEKVLEAGKRCLLRFLRFSLCCGSAVCELEWTFLRIVVTQVCVWVQIVGGEFLDFSQELIFFVQEDARRWFRGWLTRDKRWRSEIWKKFDSKVEVGKLLQEQMCGSGGNTRSGGSKESVDEFFSVSGRVNRETKVEERVGAEEIHRQGSEPNGAEKTRGPEEVEREEKIIDTRTGDGWNEKGVKEEETGGFGLESCENFECVEVPVGDQIKLREMEPWLNFPLSSGKRLRQGEECDEEELGGSEMRKRVRGGRGCWVIKRDAPQEPRISFPRVNLGRCNEREPAEDEESEWRRDSIALRRASYQVLLETNYLIQNELLEYIQELNSKKDRSEYVGMEKDDVLLRWFGVVKRLVRDGKAEEIGNKAVLMRSKGPQGDPNTESKVEDLRCGPLKGKRPREMKDLAKLEGSSERKKRERRSRKLQDLKDSAEEGQILSVGVAKDCEEIKGRTSPFSSKERTKRRMRLPRIIPGKDVNLPLVNVSIEGHQWTALLDSGASRSFLHPVCAGYFREHVRKVRVEYDFACASGQKVKTRTGSDFLQKANSVSEILALVSESEGQWVETPVIPGWEYEGERAAGDLEFNNEREEVMFEEPVTTLCPSNLDDNLPQDDLPVLTWNRRTSLKTMQKTPHAECKRLREKTKFQVRDSNSEGEEDEKVSKAKERLWNKRATVEYKARQDVVRKDRRRGMSEREKGEEPTRLSTAKEKAIGTFEELQNGRRSPEVDFEERKYVEIASLKEVRKQIRRGEVEFIGFVKIEPVRGIRKEILGGPESEEQGLLPSERIRKAGGNLDKETGEIIDELKDVFEELPPHGTVDRAVKHHIKLIPGGKPAYHSQNYNLSTES